ncbi:MAG: rRNA maturation RNase YbeY [Candidatus Margulisiibacteriota bacterium]|nr:MAG: rRNA maturation RNase YbeY [Candidatus Margulisbacteria bacterium GWD2_39_127]OGI04575.1 MAG: rRNA maturation RNase YbeY [Candidatus Margulisbacteria bacterium GWF2_38_17]OGI11893.1 MAG: rRNA maturation RNase YbeY [Candidatus Margulisbacteria bacterium GWE2_39_32]PZM83095.1 MAG: rRNA maturation RNase YbeY [Candidatus Margulisiibacteriota bacterium]HAR62238.1 rRNA maturation RNase YbeY [Candidatus Margulisiibacteriota bacterium]
MTKVIINYEKSRDYKLIAKDDLIDGMKKKDFEKLLRAITRFLMKKNNCNETEVNIVFCDNEYIKQLNSRYRDKNEPTDVLSFSFDDREFLGEVYLSLEYIAEHDKMIGKDYVQEIGFLLIHGLLHLLGYTHYDEENSIKMKDQEQYYYKEFERLYNA